MRTVDELTSRELEELRERFFYGLQDDGTMEDVMGCIIYDEEDIPMELVQDHYRGVFFCR